MDAEKGFGGTGAAVKPMEMILLGLGGCTSMDVLSILNKKKVTLDDFRVELEAEREDEHPRVFTKIIIKFFFTGNNIPRQAVERSIELSMTKYCSVTKMLQKTAEIITDYEIIEK